MQRRVMSETRAGQPSRTGTVAITAHLPQEIRDRLKILAARQRRTMNDMIAEALDELFRQHGKVDG
jgi:predicted transcriptional regulator